jgi:NTE family protein
MAAEQRHDLTADSTESERNQYLPNETRSGNALCLSGGGSRAALFHLGVLRRLNETGVLSQMDTISSVSGGSIIAAHLTRTVAHWPERGQQIPNFGDTVALPFEDVVRRNLRTPPIARRWLFPRNWLNDQAQIDALAGLFEHYLNNTRLADLPPTGPTFVFCASDNNFGVNWILTRERMGDYLAGYTPPGRVTVGRAAAASSCFPPVFDPMRLGVSPRALTGGSYPSGPKRDAIVRGLRLSDGGLYDNLALEPVWKDHQIVVASDGGGLFGPQPDLGLIDRLKRYAKVMGRQGTALRKRWLISNYLTAQLEGAYIGIGTPVSRYEVDTLGYSDDLVAERIAPIRTDLDEFSTGEIAVLQNHGYLVAEAALRRHLSRTSLAISDAELIAPYPDWLDEGKAAAALAMSGRTNLPFGRGSWLPYLRPRRWWPRARQA